ncbi:hypothetical protein [Suttonella ornithocola]|uniref:Uncharacterized protein n=1 Tax=Suttonella ornithocola TaxID=279832 RepID=A0A380MY38_9GAMM|nr:hypothetical protein [Suttonella ornithocola]SUO96813.1 Uncharacterised protein [Suttonella ornithocola]
MSGIELADTRVFFPLKVRVRERVSNKKLLIADLHSYQSAIKEVEDTMLALKQNFDTRQFGRELEINIALHLWQTINTHVQHNQLRWYIRYRQPTQKGNSNRLFVMLPLNAIRRDTNMPNHEFINAIFSTLGKSPLLDELLKVENQRLLLNSQARTIRMAISELETLIQNFS